MLRGVVDWRISWMVENACRSILSVQENGFEYIDRLLLLTLGGGQYGQVNRKRLCAEQGPSAEGYLTEDHGQAQ